VAKNRIIAGQLTAATAAGINTTSNKWYKTMNKKMSQFLIFISIKLQISGLLKYF